VPKANIVGWLEMTSLICGVGNIRPYHLSLNNVDLVWTLRQDLRLLHFSAVEKG